MRPSLLVVIVFALVSSSVPAAAQDHAHDMAEGMLLIIADTPEDGRTRVGEITHFQYVLLDPAGLPFVHHDFHVEVVLNGITLYKTESAHDYDGIGELDVVFPAPGSYTVTVTVPVEKGELVSTFAGYAVAAEDPIDAAIRLDAPTSAEVDKPVTFTYAVVDGNDSVIPHTDALVQVRRVADDFVVLEVHTHSHTTDMGFDYVFEKAGTYDVRIVGYTAFPDAASTVFHPVVHHHQVEVTGRSTPTPPRSPLAVAVPAEDPAAKGTYATHVAADPVSGTRNMTGPYSQVRASHVTYNATSMQLVQHLDYEATLLGPAGPVFASKSLHEYDGVLTILSANQRLGDYTWTMTVSSGAWKESKTYRYEVSPVLTGRTAGPQFLDVTGLEGLRVAEPKQVAFQARDAAGRPFPHSEVAFEIQDAQGLPLLRQKLHTHASGGFTFEAALDEATPHTLRVQLFDIHSSATPTYHGKDLSSARAYAFTPLQEKYWPMTVPAEAVELERHQTLPGPAVVALIALLAVALVVLRRRA